MAEKDNKPEKPKRPYPKGKSVGRPTKLTDELIEGIAKNIEAGMTIEYAAAEQGVLRGAVQQWLREGAQDIHINKKSLQSKFSYTIRAARSKLQKRLVNNIEKHGQEDWRPAAWILERTFPKDFGKRDQLKVHAAKEGETFDSDHEKLLKLMNELEDKAAIDITPERPELEIDETLQDNE